MCRQIVNPTKKATQTPYGTCKVVMTWRPHALACTNGQPCNARLGCRVARKRTVSVNSIFYEFQHLDRTARFDATGSGLLWARTTGLKLWPGATVQAEFLLRFSNQIFSNTFPPISVDHQGRSSAVSMREAGSSDMAGSGLHTLTEGAATSPISDPLTSLPWRDKVVIELGCGLGLLSTTSAWLGAQVLAGGRRSFKPRGC